MRSNSCIWIKKLHWKNILGTIKIIGKFNQILQDELISLSYEKNTTITQNKTTIFDLIFKTGKQIFSCDCVWKGLSFPLFELMIRKVFKKKKRIYRTKT